MACRGTDSAMSNDPSRDQRRLSLERLRLDAGGRWPEILVSLGIPAATLTKQNKPCPGCGGRDRFSFTDKHGSGSFVCRAMDRQGGDGFELVMHYLGCDLRQALAAVSDALGGVAPAMPPVRREAPKASPAKDDGEALRRMWKEAAPPEQGDPVWRYLERRGCLPAVMPSTLRFHPSLPYWLSDGGRPVRLGNYPAMLAAVQGPDGVTVAIHRTYLGHDGDKAAVRFPDDGECLPVKKLKVRKEGVMPGAAIRLFPVNGATLVVAEGVETALAVHALTGAPVWACVSANGLATVVLPPEAGEIVVASDHDPSGVGQRAAAALVERLKQEGRAGCVLFPSTPGLDWLDVLNAERSPA